MPCAGDSVLRASATLSYKGNAVVPMGTILSASMAEDKGIRKKKGWFNWFPSADESVDSTGAAQHKRIVPVRVEPKTFFVSTVCARTCVPCVYHLYATRTTADDGLARPPPTLICT